MDALLALFGGLDVRDAIAAAVLPVAAIAAVLLAANGDDS